MKKIINVFFFTMCMTFFAGCSKDSTPACSTATNITDASCNKTITDTTNPVTLAINFKDSWYYDMGSHTFQVIKKENLAGGIVGMTLPVYSSFLNIATDLATAKTGLASDQFARPTQYQTNEYNTIPYIEVEYEPGVTYLYQYEKKDLNNNVVFSTTGQMVIYQNRAILPFINGMFGNNFYSADSQVGSRFLHSIKISAQSQNKVGTISPTIEFETNFQIPNVDFAVTYADSMKSFTLQDRFKSYFKSNTDYNYNDQFKFFTLTDLSDVAQQIPLDLRIVFQTPPKMQIEQEVFFELPLNSDSIKTLSKATDTDAQRGFAFFTQKGTFDSDTDFKMKVKMNNQFLTLSSQRQVDVLNVPAGTRWDIDFFYDFNQNALYTGNDGKPLFNPLRPECKQIPNVVFNPLQEIYEKNLAILNGGYIAICHPKTNDKLIIPSDQMTITPYETIDTYYSHFNYMAMNLQNRDVGFFSGIRRVTFKIEGCMRVLARQAGTSTWEIKTKSNAQCEQDGSTGATGTSGWAYFYAEKTATIFDNIADYDLYPGLKSLMQYFGSKPVKQTTDFNFNGDINNNRHIY